MLRQKNKLHSKFLQCLFGVSAKGTCTHFTQNAKIYIINYILYICGLVFVMGKNIHDLHFYLQHI